MWLPSLHKCFRVYRSFIASLRTRAIAPLLRPGRRLAIIEACLIGLISALAAVLLKSGIGWLGTWRIQSSLLYPVWCVLPAIGLVLGAMSGWILEGLAPESGGSGIPQVKAVLAQFPLPLDLRVALVKLVTAILALGSGLALGRQGPTVHIGAAVASQFSHWVPTSPDHRRQMIAAGAGAGLAAGFNAPIAGILFVV
jgi:CIC family chloride channel protein